MTETVLIVPGLRNSGPAHWQSLWQLKHPEYVRVMQQDWNAPHLGNWVASLDRAVRSAPGPVFLVAHSFGCLAAVRRISRGARGIAGALLVAPADPDKFAVAGELPHGELGVSTVLAASRNDPWMSFEKARALASKFGSGFIDLGSAGHVNAEAGYGPWLEGERLLARLTASPAFPEEAVAA